MKETKQAPGTPEARAAMHEMMAAFEAFKGANDARLDEIERKASADMLLEEKVARIDQAVGQAQARLDRVVSEGRRPELGATPSVGFAATSPMKGEEKSALDGALVPQVAIFAQLDGQRVLFAEPELPVHGERLALAVASSPGCGQLSRAQVKPIGKRQVNGMALSFRVE